MKFAVQVPSCFLLARFLIHIIVIILLLLSSAYLSERGVGISTFIRRPCYFKNVHCWTPMLSVQDGP